MAIEKDVYLTTVNGKKDLGQVGLCTKDFGRILTTGKKEFLILYTPRLSQRTASGNAYIGYLQVRINTTEFMIYPDGSQCPGISNIISPYSKDDIIEPFLENKRICVILGGQNYEFIFTLDKNSKIAYGDYIEVMVPFVRFTEDDYDKVMLMLERNELITPEAFGY